MNRRYWRFGFGLILLCMLPGSFVHAAIDPNAEIVLVRKDCGTLDDCFETLDGAENWAWNTRFPNANAPLVIDIGPGSYAETFNCPDGRGYVTVRGAGRDATKITGHPTTNTSADLTNCVQMEFIDMTFQNQEWAVHWAGGGSSTWTDVDVIALPGGNATIGWIDDIVGGQEEDIALHYFFGCRIRAFGRANNSPYPVAAFWASASESWFFGGEVEWEVYENGTGSGAAVVLNAGSDFRAFGTTIRAHAEGLLGPVTGTVNGVSVSDAAVVGNNAGEPATFHMHGGIISVSAGTQSIAAYGLTVAGANASAHTPDTAFVVKSPVFSIRLLEGAGASASSPLLWPASTQPPSATFFSKRGEDMYVETDCKSNGDCNDPAGNETHLMIYDYNCGSDPWFDTVTGRCRNVIQ